MRFFYTLLFYSLSPFLIFRLLWKSRRLPEYRAHIAERFAFKIPANLSVDVWIHAVSVGEAAATQPLVEKLLARKQKILITSTTPTGRAQVQKLFGERVLQHYLPYDLPMVIRRFLKAYQPKKIIIMETEIWPNLLTIAHKKHIPLILANARLSQNSFRNYQKIKIFVKPILQTFTKIAAQTKADQERFIALGAHKEQCLVLGNMKFDIAPQKDIPDELKSLKIFWGETRTVLLVASTHAPEETFFLEKYVELKTHIPNLLLVLAPRHPERFESVQKEASQRGFDVGIRTDLASIHPQIDILILNTIGELSLFYQLCDYAFVGGSLAPIGGHNVLEPITYKKPVFTGPYVHHFKHICQQLEECKGIKIAQNITQFSEMLIELHHHPYDVEQQIQQASKILEENQGAVLRHLQLLEECS